MDDLALITKQDGEFLGVRYREGGGTVPPGDYISADTGNLITVGTDGKLLVPTDPNIARLNAEQAFTARQTFQDDPVITNGTAVQRAFSDARSTRYVTEQQLRAGGVGHATENLSDLLIIQKREGAINTLNLTRKNGFAFLASQINPAVEFRGMLIATLPAEWRPAIYFVGYSMVRNPGQQNILVVADIATNGELRVHCHIAGTHVESTGNALVYFDYPLL
jgi:hypothetical protein